MIKQYGKQKQILDKSIRLPQFSNIVTTLVFSSHDSKDTPNTIQYNPIYILPYLIVSETYKKLDNKIIDCYLVIHRT